MESANLGLKGRAAHDLACRAVKLIETATGRNPEPPLTIFSCHVHPICGDAVGVDRIMNVSRGTAGGVVEREELLRCGPEQESRTLYDDTVDWGVEPL